MPKPRPVSAKSLEFIGAMKVVAIAQRGTKRDFVDLYCILQDIPFWKIAERMALFFGKERINPVLFGKALVYFADAEADPEPRYLGSTAPKWADMKKFFRSQVRQMVFDLQAARDPGP